MLELTTTTPMGTDADVATGFESAGQVSVAVASAEIRASAILRDIMQFRRVTAPSSACDVSSCLRCLAPHLAKVVSAIVRDEAIILVLPAFPGKSPNPAKILGPLPDMAERRALGFLNELCNRIKQLHNPGARIILCSDGRVFSDVIGMNEDDVTNYRAHLDQIIGELGATNLSTFTLDELRDGGDTAAARLKLMDQYGQSLESLRERVRRGRFSADYPEDEEAHRMYCGITRFLVEDAMHPGQVKSRSAIQKDCRIRAYEVIRRSNAWSELIAERFPGAVRLSIHPQTCGSRKIGIQLLGTDSWMTPWHGVAVDTGEDFVLMKRSEAESLGAALIRNADGRASHYKLN